jgi:hypothetical protein
MVNGVTVRIRYRTGLRRVDRRRQVPCYCAGDLDPRHLASYHENLAPFTIEVAQQTAEISILTTVKYWDIRSSWHQGGHCWFAKETRSNEEIVKGFLFHLAIVGAGLHPPSGACASVGRSLHKFGPLHAPSELQLGFLAITALVTLEVASNLPRSWQLGSILFPGKVAELDSVLALVRDHERMDEAGTIVASQRPETANAGLGIEDCHIECPARYVVKQ